MCHICTQFFPSSGKKTENHMLFLMLFNFSLALKPYSTFQTSYIFGETACCPNYTHTQGFIILLLQNNFHLNRTSCYARGWMGRFLNERGIFGCSEYGGKGRRGKNFNATSRGSIVVFWKYCCSQMLPPFNALLFFLSKGQS